MTSGNLPGPGAVILDHTGHFVPDAEAARTALEALGFMVTPFSAQVQPDPETGAPRLTGTGNVCAMLPEGYLEILVHTADTPLGREFQAALDRRAGLHLAAFGVADAAEWHVALEAAGRPVRPLVQMSREVETETGRETARFTVARLAAGAMEEGRVQFVTHATAAAMWQPRWTAHPNGARALRAVVVSAPDVEATAARFADLLGRPATQAGAGLAIALDRGAVEVLPEAAATALAGAPVEPGRSAFAAVRIAVDDPGALRARAEAAGLSCREAEGALVVPFAPALGRGAWIFEPAGG